MANRCTRAVLAATAMFLVVCAVGAARAGGASVRARYDVACKVKLAPGTVVTAGTTVRMKFVAKNRGRRPAESTTMAIYADAVVGTPLWSEVTTVRGHRRRVRILDVAVPQTARTLIAVAECEVDDNPGNNLAGIPVVGWTDPGTGDPPPTPIDPAILAGAATYSAACAVCHGADGTGTSAGPNLLHRSAGDLYESFQQGPGAMPTFPDLTRTDASNVSRFLEDPAAATPPPPPDPGPAPDPTPTPPTYTANVKPYLDASCAVCHKGSTAPRKIKLDSYANASANAQATLTAMQGGTMPPGNPATAGQIQMVADWIAAGLPQ